MSISSVVRRMFGEGDKKRDAGLTTPADIRRYDNIPYGSDPYWQSLDLYRPRAAEGQRLPVIVSVHGGGWVYGDKEVYQFYCMSLAQRGFVVVNYTYRLAPEFKFPASLEDTCAVFQWVQQYADRYLLDADHVFAVGDSAGGHLLSLFTALCANPAYARRFSFQPPKGFVPSGIALNCGAYRLDLTGTNGQLMAELLPNKGTKEELALIDATAYVTKKYPPVFLMTCTGDFLQDQAPLMAQQLMKHAVPFTFRFYGDRDHELGHIFHCNMRMEEAKVCNDDECAFFRSLMG